MEAHIAITKFHGFNGGFATKEVELYRVEVVGPTGIAAFVPMGPMGQSNQIRNVVHAQSVAQYWSELTGWPIRRFKEKRVYRSEVVPDDE